MACGPGFTAGQCRAQHIAPSLSDAEQDGTGFEARCPACGHGGFRISQPDRSRYRHIWVCACRRCHCQPAAIRAELLAAGVMPGCLGLYGATAKASTDPNIASALEAAARDIISAPGLKPADIRVVLAEALGEKVPADYRAFAKWAMSIGIGRTQAYEAAARWCRPSDCHPSRGGEV